MGRSSYKAEILDDCSERKRLDSCWRVAAVRATAAADCAACEALREWLENGGELLRRRASVREWKDSRARRREVVRVSASEVRVRIRVVRESRVGRGEVVLGVGVRVDERVLIWVERWVSEGRMGVCEAGAVGRVVDRPRAASREVSRSANRDIAAMFDGIGSGGNVCLSGCWSL